MPSAASLAFYWADHRFFMDAPAITGRAREIDEIHTAYGPLAPAWIPRTCEEKLFDLFEAQAPTWPAYDSWASALLSKGISDTVFGPLIIPPTPEDFLEHVTLATLRDVARSAGLVKAGRSKAEVLAKLTPLIGPEVLAVLQKEGHDRWDRFERRPALMTHFRVLHNAISAIICTTRHLMMLSELRGANGVWSAAPDEMTCSNCRALDGSNFSPAVELRRRLIEAPPLHPGCRCASISTL